MNAVRTRASAAIKSLLALIIFAVLSVDPMGGLSCLVKREGHIQPNDPSLVWTKPEEVKRQPKKYQKTKPKRVTQTIPVLALRMWVLKRDEALKPVATSPDAVFQIDDRLQLVAQANQNGYLYLVQYGAAGDAPLLFPDSRINDGQNFVKKEKEIVIPSNCPAENNDENGNCWWRVNDEDDELTVIFSREMLLDIPDNPGPTAKKVRVKRRTVSALYGTQDQSLQKVTLDNRYMVQFWNADRANNEILIAKITIKHEKPERSK